MKSIKTSFHFLIIVAILATVWNCKNEPAEKIKSQPIQPNDSNYIVADTITYDVIIKDIDSTQIWQKEFLKYLNRSMLIDSIFAGVYTGRLTAHDFFTDKKLSLKEVREIEDSDWFSRNAIGKIQFNEVWAFNLSNHKFEKKVNSLVLGVEQFDQFGNFKGHKPVFKIYMNQ